MAGCAASSVPAAPSPSRASPVPFDATPTAAARASVGTTTFTSTTYGYSLMVQTGWTTVQASMAWDGNEAAFHDVPQADQFVGPAAASSWAVAAPTLKDLAGYVKERIAANAAVPGGRCPATPDAEDPIEIGGEPGTLLAWNCGILINSAVTVHDGIGYAFGFRDPSVHAATDPTDRAILLELLESVGFPAGPFRSVLYGYVIASPDWTGTGAAIAWDGTGSPGDGDPMVDALVGPGLRAFAYGEPTTATLDAFADALRVTNATVHPCPAKPGSTIRMTVGGSPALLDTLDCGVFVMTAYVVREDRTHVFFTYGQLEKEAAIRVGFGSLLEAISFEP